MLLPTQQAYGRAATSLMQSVLDDINERSKKRQEETGAKPKVDPVIEAKISASEDARRAKDKIAEALFGLNQVDINEMRMDLIEQLGHELGIDVEKAKSSYSLGSAFEEAIKGLDRSAKTKIEKTLGLDELGITLDHFVASVKNPYGDDNDRLKDALEKKAGGGSGLADSRKVLQRLEDITDPKTLAELKLGPQYSDPTRVEDAETRAERLQDIANAEVSQKLEDVRKSQEVIEEHNDFASKLPQGGVDGAASLDPANMLQVLAAAAEQIETAEETPDPDDPSTSTEADTAAAMGEADSEAVAQIRTGQAEMLRDEQADQAMRPEILSVEVDEIGLYSLLKKFLPLAA